MCTRMKFNFKCQQCGKGKGKPCRNILIQMATLHSKLGISLPNLAHYTYNTELAIHTLDQMHSYYWYSVSHASAGSSARGTPNLL
jgi:hypothetical protein